MDLHVMYYYLLYVHIQLLLLLLRFPVIISITEAKTGAKTSHLSDP